MVLIRSCMAGNIFFSTSAAYLLFSTNSSVFAGTFNNWFEIVSYSPPNLKQYHLGILTYRNYIISYSIPAYCLSPLFLQWGSVSPDKEVFTFRILFDFQCEMKWLKSLYETHTASRLGDSSQPSGTGTACKRTGGKKCP